MLSLLYGSWDLHSGPHTCAASALKPWATSTASLIIPFIYSSCFTFIVSSRALMHASFPLWCGLAQGPAQLVTAALSAWKDASHRHWRVFFCRAHCFCWCLTEVNPRATPNFQREAKSHPVWSQEEGRLCEANSAKEGHIRYVSFDGRFHQFISWRYIILCCAVSDQLRNVKDSVNIMVAMGSPQKPTGICKK